jgi:hypothetical protein
MGPAFDSRLVQDELQYVLFDFCPASFDFPFGDLCPCCVHLIYAFTGAVGASAGHLGTTHSDTVDSDRSWSLVEYRKITHQRPNSSIFFCLAIAN